MKRAEAVAVLKIILEEGIIIDWSIDEHPDSCQLKLKPRARSFSTVEQIASEHNLKSKVDDGKITIF